MITSWCPPNKVEEQTNTYTEVLKKIPHQPFEKQHIIGFVNEYSSDVLKGYMRAIDIVEVEKGKYEEVLNLIYRPSIEYFGIKGYRFKIETFLTFQEGIIDRIRNAC